MQDVFEVLGVNRDGGSIQSCAGIHANLHTMQNQGSKTLYNINSFKKERELKKNCQISVNTQYLLFQQARDQKQVETKCNTIKK